MRKAREFNNRYAEYKLTCQGCDEPFTAFKKGAKYCTPTCGQNHRRKTRRLAGQLESDKLTEDEKDFVELFTAQEEFAALIPTDFKTIKEDLAYIKNNPDGLPEDDLAWWKLSVLNDIDNLKIAVNNLAEMLKKADLYYLDLFAIGLTQTHELIGQITAHVPDLSFETDKDNDDDDEGGEPVEVESD